MRTCAFALAALFIASGSQCFAEDPAALLLAKHYAYVGWTYGDARVPTLKLTGHIEDVKAGAEPVRTYDTVELMSGLITRYTAVSRKTGLEFDTGFTGKIFWSSGDNGFTVPERGDGIMDRIAEQVVFGEATTGLAGAVRKSDTIDGQAVTVVRVTPPHAFAIDLYVDPQSGAYKRIVFDPEGKNYAVDIDRYTEFGTAKRAIGAWHYRGSSARHVVDSIEAGVTITALDLHPPAPAAEWTFGSGAPTAIELRPADVPSRKLGDTALRIYVNATVDGVPGHFILDTGSSDISFTDSFARKLNLKQIESRTYHGIAGNIVGKVSRVDSIAFGDGSTLKNVLVSSGLRDEGERYDGLMGYSFLGGAVVSLDLDHQTMRILDPAVAPDPQNGYVLLPDLSGGVPILPVVLGGNVKSSVLLDSGTPFYALLSHDYVSRLRILVDHSSLASELTFGGVSSGTESDECAPLSSIALGPIVYTNAPACFSNSFTSRDGLVGLDFMKHFNMTFDYPDGKIVFFPRK